MCSSGGDVTFKFLIKLKSKITEPICSSWGSLCHASARPVQNAWAHRARQWRFSEKMSEGSGAGVHCTGTALLGNQSFPETDQMILQWFPLTPLTGYKTHPVNIWVALCSPPQLQLPCWGSQTTCFIFLFKINNFVVPWLTFKALHSCQLAGLLWARECRWKQPCDHREGSCSGHGELWFLCMCCRPRDRHWWMWGSLILSDGKVSGCSLHYQ